MKESIERADHPQNLCYIGMPVVCLVAAGEIFGGAERQIIWLVQYIQCRCDISVALFHDGDLAKRLRDLGVRVKVIDRGMAGVVSLRRFLIEVGADVLHVHGYRAAIVSAVAACGLPMKVVKTVHGAPEVGKITTLSGVRARMYYLLEAWAESFVMPHLVYVTHDLSQRLRASQKPNEWSVIYNGISLDVEGETSPPPEFAEARKVVLVLGRLEFVKGVDSALRTFSKMRDQNTHLAVVGDGPERQRLERMAKSLGIDGRVSFCGFRSDVTSYLSKAAVLLIPSRHEGLPYTLLEAMTMSTPVVATKVGGVGEVLTHEKNALLCDPDNSRDMANCIERVLTDPVLAGRLAASARCLVASRFSASVMADHYLSVYRSSSKRVRPSRRAT